MPTKAELLQLNKLNFLPGDFLLVKKVGNRKNLDHFCYVSFKSWPVGGFIFSDFREISHSLRFVSFTFFGQKITNVAIVIHKYSQFSCRTMYFRSTQLCSRFGRAERQCENSIDYILKELCKLIDCFKLQQIFVAPNFALAHMD